jgi:hypothetical protein
MGGRRVDEDGPGGQGPLSKRSPHSYMHDDDLYGVQGIEDEVLVWVSQKE